MEREQYRRWAGGGATDDISKDLGRRKMKERTAGKKVKREVKMKWTVR